MKGMFCLLAGVAFVWSVTVLCVSKDSSMLQKEVKPAKKVVKLTREEVSTRIMNGCRRNESSGEGFLSCMCSASYVSKKLGDKGLIRFMLAQEERNLVKVNEVIADAANGNDWDRFNSVHMCVMKIKMESQTGYRVY